MSDKHAYLNASDVVVQVIAGAVEGDSHDLLLRDYAVLFGAVRCVRVSEDTPVWIDGMYTDGEFLAPYVEPEPVVQPEVEIENDVIAES